MNKEIGIESKTWEKIANILTEFNFEQAADVCSCLNISCKVDEPDELNQGPGAVKIPTANEIRRMAKKLLVETVLSSKKHNDEIRSYDLAGKLQAHYIPADDKGGEYIELQLILVEWDEMDD